MTNDGPVHVRLAELPDDRDAVARLWLEYLSWGNDEMEARHGFRLPVREAVERDLAAIHKFQPPHGRIVLAVGDGRAYGIGCLQRIGSDTAEIKRMYVEPAHRRAGAGSSVLERLLAEAEGAGYTQVRLDSPDFMSAAHAMYRRHGFVDIAAYPESEIPDEYKAHWVFMERGGRPG
jgi:GNAT superfamily N-acetyltransferase